MNIKLCGSRLQKQGFVSPVRIRNLNPVRHDRGGTPEPYIEVLGDLETPSQLGGDITIDRLAQDIPGEKCDANNDHKQQGRNACQPADAGGSKRKLVH